MEQVDIDVKAGIEHPEYGPGGLRRLVDHGLWANRRWIEHVHRAPQPEPRPREILAHIVVGEEVWFERIAGTQRTTVFFPLLEREELLARLEANHRTSLGLIGGRLDEVIHFRRATGEEYHARVAEIVVHLCTHGYHHRGQLAAFYARSGAPYPNTDHINFLIEQQL